MENLSTSFSRDYCHRVTKELSWLVTKGHRLVLGHAKIEVPLQWSCNFFHKNIKNFVLWRKYKCQIVGEKDDALEVMLSYQKPI